LITSAPLDIRERFDEEQAYVGRYVDFLEMATAVRHSQVSELLRILTRYRIGSIVDERGWKKWNAPYTANELAELLSQLNAIGEALASAIENAQASAVRHPEPENLRQIDARSNLGEWIEFARDAVHNPDDEAALASLREDIRTQQERNRQEVGEDAQFLSGSDIEYVLGSAAFLVSRGRLYKLQAAREQIRELDLLARVIRQDTELSVLRQGFILLMTAFDAAVFDLTRLSLRADFFGLIASFGKQERIALEELGQFGSFEAFRDAQIERQLRGRYLREILFILVSLGVPLTDQGRGDRTIHLVELVMRRNLHVHNRGVVDERYLERDQTGAPRFNIYDLQLGTVAHIDGSHWKRSNELVATAVQQLTAWVEARGR